VAIPIQCPECHKKYQAPDHMAGKRVKCKHCGVIFLIAADARSADAGADMSALDELNALSASGTHEAHTRVAGGGFGAAAGDLDSIFQAEYAAEGAPRTNKLYVFPLSRLLDRWLPQVLLAVGLVWACYEAFNRNDTTRAWVGFFRAGVFLLAFFASVLPFTLMGVRAASRNLNYELPPRPGLRTMGSYAVPFALACAMWLLLGGVSGLLIGALIGCVVALPVLFLLFRLLPREAPVTFGYATGSFLLSVLVSVAAVVALNLMLVGILRAAKADLALAVSPFGAGLKWDAAPENVRRQLAQNTPTDPDEPAATTQESSDTQPAATDPADETAPATPTTRTVVAANIPVATAPSVPAERDVVRPADTGHADANPSQVSKTNEAEKPIKANTVRVEVAARLVGNVRVVVPGPFKQVIHPAVPAQRLAVVRDGRPGHDKVELWDTAQWQKAADLEVPRTPEGNRYVLSPDGDTLCYVTDFPRLAVQVWSFKTGRALRAVDLEPADGPPELLGFASPEQLVLRRQRNGETVLQVWNPRTPGRPKQFTVSDFEPDPARYTISPDGNMVAFIVPGSSGADLESYSLSTGRPIKQMPIVEVNWNNNVTVAGLAFTPDSQRVSAVFADGQGAGFVVEWPAAGKAGRPLLQQLLPLGVNLPPRQPGATARLFDGRPFSWLDNGHAFLLYGSSVLDTDSGVQLGTLDLPRPRSQSTDPAADACSVVGSDEFGGVHVFAVKLDLAGARKRLVPGK
jgi:hypothetical protein